MSNIVEVVAYENNWPELFLAEASLIKEALGANCITIYHIGSTAVPGLSAKPIIDILPVVKDISLVGNAVSQMVAIGYCYRGEYGIPFRRYFQKFQGDKRTHHVHIFEVGNSEIDRHLKFRDWMCAHADDREAYAQLKKELALKYPDDILNYCEGKEAFIATIDNKSGFTGLRMVQALTKREWEAVKNLRQKFFDKGTMNDLYHWTFKDSSHKHLILYKESTIIGYAHIQLCSNNKAILRIIVIEERYRNLGFGSLFLKYCEKWLAEQNIKEVLVPSSREAYHLYRKNNYVKMSFNDPQNYPHNPHDIKVGKILRQRLIDQ
ncbi:bifunctional GrpB family protein/GNAT family N-acetyltransferase [Legionella gresilensis]|uniref:bifunctional GrpB family protein/GNAT family N-acetyltransferase n=1 Tax=Legionella gresilensis TaxID=91823 RepID=UPI001040FAAB|nr:bifunctional GrpB family protein/GNAT family N-acetyltransferase [Legionella gresilensis]